MAVNILELFYTSACTNLSFNISHVLEPAPCQGSFSLAIGWKAGALCWSGQGQYINSLTVPAWLMVNIKNIITSRDSSQVHLTHKAVHARLNIMPTQTNHWIDEKEPQLYKLQNYYITQIKDINQQLFY